jgi:hypothetical protein
MDGRGEKREKTSGLEKKKAVNLVSSVYAL